ncbi:MAG: hypothetical protein AAGB93_00675 [Planctomycetota bacterium]
MRAIEDGRITSEAAWKNDRGWWVVQVERGARDLDAEPAPAGRKSSTKKKPTRRRPARNLKPTDEPPAEASGLEAAKVTAKDCSIGTDLVPRGPDGQPLKKAQVQTAREAVLTQLALLELERERGRLVPAAEVSSCLSELGRITLDGLSALPARVAPRIVTCSDVLEVELILEQAILHAVRKLVDANSRDEVATISH